MPPPERPKLTLILGRRPRRHDPWVIGAALVPLLPLLVLTSYVLRARVALGGWPTAASPGAVELGFELHHLLVVLAINAVLVSPLWTGAVALIRWALHGPRYRMLAGLVLGACVWGAAMAWVFVDPGELVAWTVGPAGTFARLG